MKLVNQKSYDVRFTTSSVKVQSTRNRLEHIDEYAVILLMNRKNGRSIVHPFTSFVYQWKRKEFNTQLARAKHVVAFLNYLFFDENKPFTIKDLSDLQIIHGIYFLETKVEKGVSKDTIDAYDSTLMKFYYYLSENRLLENISKDDFGWDTNPKKGTVHLKSFFRESLSSEPTVRRKYKDDKARSLESRHFLLFIEIASRVAPDIALGIYFSMLGGLRGSEVLSVKRSKIRSININGNGEHGLILELETDKKSAKGSGNRVKSPGKQVIEPVEDLLPTLYKRHMSYCKVPIDGSDSLFVNKHGRAMQYQTYNNRFNQVKRAFIEHLKGSNQPEDKIAAVNYSSLKWSTHIGRGTYSQVIAEGAKNIFDVMRMRRDRSPDSVNSYLTNTQSSINKINIRLEDLYENDD